MKYVALFRGLNVGGKNRVKMDALKHMFLACGFEEVQTYIQSGNVIFTADQQQSLLVEAISQAFLARFGFKSDVILRSKDEVNALLSGFPFTDAEIAQANFAAPDIEHVYIYFSESAIDAPAFDKIAPDFAGKDRLHVGKRELFLLTYGSVRDSKLAAQLAKPGFCLTARNLKTVEKIQELLAR